MIFQQAAEELVRATSSLVSGRTINIMNPDGIIIASSDPKRVGTFHFGADQVMHTGRSVNITRSQLPAYPGALEGCNMPLRQNGKIIGVVGITGDPEELQDLAHLLEVYAMKYMELESVVMQHMEEAEIRRKLFHLLTTQDSVNPEYVRTLSETASFQLQFPARVIAIRVVTGTLTLREFEQILLQEQLLDHKKDLSCEEENYLMLLKSAGVSDFDTYSHRISKAIERNGCHVRITAGRTCENTSELSASYQESRLLNTITPNNFEDADTPRVRCALLTDASIRDQMPYLKRIYENLQAQFRPDELQTLLSSAKAYYEEGRSVTKAAARLFVHKNTLQYRLHRLLKAMQLTEESGFYQEYLVRFVLQYRAVYYKE